MIFNINSTRGHTGSLLVKYYKKEEKNNFQCQLSRIYFYMEKNPHFRDSRYITIPADVWDNSLGKQMR